MQAQDGSMQVTKPPLGASKAALRPPYFIRAYVKHALLCYLIWLTIPLVLTVLVSSRISLSDPKKGWRVRETVTATQLDANQTSV